MLKKLVFVFLWLVLQAGSTFGQKSLTLIFSQDYGKGEYRNWVLRHNPNCRIVSLYHVQRDSINYWLNRADGYLLTGGEDVYPGLYNQAKDTVDCGEIDRWRDSLEYRILDAAFLRKKPVFGICRGEQISNVYLGGSLYVDVPTDLGTSVSHRKEGPTQHEIQVLESTSLENLSKIKSGSILSNHHQGIKKLGKGLKPMAKSSDGLIEAVEGTPELKMPFFMAVQWHPERMEENHPLSKSLAKAFISACENGLK